MAQMYGGGYMMTPPAPLSGGVAPPPTAQQQHPLLQHPQMMHHHHYQQHQAQQQQQQQQHNSAQALPMQQQQHLNLHQQQQHFYHQQQQQQHHQHHQQQQQHHAQQQQQQQLFAQQQQQAVDTQLQFVAGRYRDVMRARHDVLVLLHATPSLYPHTAAPGPGAPPLLYVSGTLPIAYKGSQYNIPIQFTIPEGYPHSPPVCKVTPTETMVVKSNHKHVDSGGICYHPYLSGWRADVCSLVGATNELKAIFAADPPVRAKPVIKHSTSAPLIASATAFPVAPQSAPAPVPVYPYAPPPAYASLAPAGPPTTGPGSSPAAFPVPLPAYAHHQYGTPHPPTTTTTLSAPATLLAQPPMSASSASTSAHQHQQRPQQSPARDVLLSEVGKRYADLRKVVELEEEKKRLTEEYKEVKKMASQIERSNRRKEDGQLDVDTASNPRNPKDLTIMSLKAEDAAMEDTLYHMMRALADEAIDSATYVKHVRLLSREQFMVRAKLNKAHQQT